LTRCPGIIALAFCLITGCTTVFNQYTYVQEDLSVEQWIKSSDAKKGYIFVSGMMDPVMSSNVIKKIMELNNHDDVERIRLIINTNGGEANSYRAIMNVIGTIQKPVDTINIGSCYSAGVGLFASASGKRYAFPKTHFMVHQPFTNEWGSGADNLVSFESNMYETTIRRRSNLPGNWFPLDEKMIFFTSEEAEKYGLVDEIITKLP
jgi:ATP-dependent Clp endopeptidase proteolytic subunit ClpP